MSGMLRIRTANYPQQRIANVFSAPAPFGGWNLRNSLDDMPTEDAIRLENWFPDGDKVRLRDGFDVLATGVGSGDVEFVYGHEDGTNSKLLAAGGGAVYNATAAGAATSLASGFGSNRWQAATMSGKTILVNGTDTPQSYDGATLGTASLSGSGLTATNLIAIAAFKGRLFYAEVGTANLWYGDPGAVTGTLTKFQLGLVARGGFLQAIGTWSRDSGDGPDDLLVLAMSTGEVIVYQGTDITSTGTWAIVGSYPSAPPIGRRCLLKLGGELVIVTTGGFMPVSLILAGAGGPELDNHPIWGKIRPAALIAAANYGTAFGWQITKRASRDAVIVNIPVSSTRSEQYVVNVVTGAWCKYTSASIWPLAWGTLGTATYAGGRGGQVYSHAGLNDAGGSITVRAKTAFSYMGDRQSRKRFSGLRPLFSVDGRLTASLGLDVDFSQRTGLSSVDLSSASNGTPWGSLWSSPWSISGIPVSIWASFPGIGRCAAVRFEAEVMDQNLAWYSTQFMGQFGGRL